MSVEPRCTYRLQLTPEFGFDHVQALVPYLRDLGISHLYLSPALQARPGSTHGYDVIDPSRLSDALGGDAGFRRLAQCARDAGMGIVLDVVPNHLAADDANRYWADPALRERFFDIDPVTGRHRRFFDVDDLAAVRQEDPEVFEATHQLVLSLLRDGLIDGLRVDHPDGLADPAGYLARLRERGAERVWVEKILDPGERLRDWPVAGTVGYEFLNDLTALFVDPAGEAGLTALWELVSGDRRRFCEYAGEAKLEQITGPFRPELERLARVLHGEQAVRAQEPAVRDCEDAALDCEDAALDCEDAALDCEDAVSAEELAGALCSLPVYRTYVDPLAGVVAAADREAVAGAASMPRAIAEMLLLERPAPAEFVTRFQQTTPTVMAKGVEDTAFYRYARLLALNDVGGDPSRFGITVARFHEANRERAQRFPQNLLTAQTHDAKRSNDVRARIVALSSIPDQWAGHVGRWLELSEPLRSGGAPDDVERYFIFQTLVGTWPIELERIEAYMEKALREAKRNTNWIDQNAEWEAAVKRFCAALYASSEFLAEFEPFARRVARAGARIALAQHVLQLTAPGIPDIFQGHELPRHTLVDPDNRRPVDWGYNEAMLRRLMGGSPPTDENYKQFLTLRLLGLRTRRPEPFAGSYVPLEAGAGVCAYLRGDEVLVAVDVRGEVGEGWLEPPGGRWRDLLRGEERSFRRREPVARLIAERGIAVFERL